MASVNRDKKGRWRVQFKTGSRHTLRLGSDISQKGADAIGRHIDELLESKRHGLPVPAATAQWVDRLPDELRLQLVQMDVIEDTGNRAVSSLGAFLTDYINSRTDIESSTRCNYETVKRWLIQYFGEQRALKSISAGEADTFRIWLGDTGRQAPNTVRRACSRAKQFFRAAVRRRLIQENPFQDMKHLIVGASPKERLRFIDQEITARVMRACPDSHWRTIFALARYGGLRVPSEICILKWSDIDWKNGRVLINCQKTKGHGGREFRVLPLFSELRRELAAWRAEAPEEREFILKPAVSPKTNLRTGLIKILKRAGIKPWPKLYQNLRASRATELRDHFPTHVVAAWLGHTVKVADGHYNQVTDDHFRRAVAADRNDEPPAHGAA